MRAALWLVVAGLFLVGILALFAVVGSRIGAGA